MRWEMLRILAGVRDHPEASEQPSAPGLPPGFEDLNINGPLDASNMESVDAALHALASREQSNTANEVQQAAGEAAARTGLREFQLPHFLAHPETSNSNAGDDDDLSADTPSLRRSASAPNSRRRFKRSAGPIVHSRLREQQSGTAPPQHRATRSDGATVSDAAQGAGQAASTGRPQGDNATQTRPGQSAPVSGSPAAPPGPSLSKGSDLQAGAQAPGQPGTGAVLAGPVPASVHQAGGIAPRGHSPGSDRPGSSAAGALAPGDIATGSRPAVPPPPNAPQRSQQASTGATNQAPASTRPNPVTAAHPAPGSLPPNRAPIASIPGTNNVQRATNPPPPVPGQAQRQPQNLGPASKQITGSGQAQHPSALPGAAAAAPHPLRVTVSSSRQPQMRPEPSRTGPSAAVRPAQPPAAVQPQSSSGPPSHRGTAPSNRQSEPPQAAADQQATTTPAAPDRPTAQMQQASRPNPGAGQPCAPLTNAAPVGLGHAQGLTTAPAKPGSQGQPGPPQQPPQSFANAAKPQGTSRAQMHPQAPQRFTPQGGVKQPQQAPTPGLGNQNGRSPAPLNAQASPPSGSNRVPSSGRPTPSQHPNPPPSGPGMAQNTSTPSAAGSQLAHGPAPAASVAPQHPDIGKPMTVHSKAPFTPAQAPVSRPAGPQSQPSRASQGRQAPPSPGIPATQDPPAPPSQPPPQQNRSQQGARGSAQANMPATQQASPPSSQSENRGLLQAGRSPDQPSTAPPSFQPAAGGHSSASQQPSGTANHSSQDLTREPSLQRHPAIHGKVGPPVLPKSTELPRQSPPVFGAGSDNIHSPTEEPKVQSKEEFAFHDETPTIEDAAEKQPSVAGAPEDHGSQQKSSSRPDQPDQPIPNGLPSIPGLPVDLEYVEGEFSADEMLDLLLSGKLPRDIVGNEKNSSSALLRKS
jgi:hypothetical protein